MVTSDSLGAESIQEGGSFAANSDSRGPSAQPSYSTTSNTTDVSGATRLDPAPDAEARQASEEWSESAQMNAGAGLGKESGVGPTFNTGGTLGGASGGVSDTTNQSSSYDTGNAAPAPGAQDHPAPVMGDDFKPKGKNITEGGFDSDAPNASFNTDIGGKDDPGRVALEQMEGENTPFAGGAGPKQGEVSNDGQYDVLKDESA